MITKFILRRRPEQFGRQAERHSVLTDGVDVGTISRVMRSGTATAWQWSIAVVPAVPPTSGTCETLEEAMAEFRAAWHRQTIDLEAWRKHMDDVQRRADLWARKGDLSRENSS